MSNTSSLLINRLFIIFLPLWPIFGFINKNKYEPSFVIDSLFIFSISLIVFLFLIYYVFSLFFSKLLAIRITSLIAVILCYLQLYYDFKLRVFHVVEINAFSTEHLRFLVYSYLVLGIVASFVMFKISASHKMSKVLTVTSLVLLLYSVLSIIKDTGHIKFKFFDNSSKNYNHQIKKENTHMPNVYYFVYDGYLRSSSLEKFYGYNNDGFVQSLKKFDFHTITNSYSNFGTTKHSLNLSYNPYLADLPKDELLKNLEELYSYNGEDDLDIANTFRELGYDFSMMNFNGERVKACGEKCIVLKQEIPFVVLQLLKNTPMYDIAIKFYPSVVSNWLSKVPNDNRYAIKHLPSDLKSPFLLISHVLLPHPPYSFNENCEYDYKEGIDYNLDPKENVTLIRKKYLKQVSCANNQMLDIVGWLRKNDPKAIAFFVSDHGWKDDYSIIDINPKNVILRNHNFISILFPKRCKNLLKEKLTLVNMFPLALSCITNKKVKLFPDTIYRVEDDDGEKKLIDISDLIKNYNDI